VGQIEPAIYRLKDGAEVTLRTAVEQDAAPLLATIVVYMADNEGMSWAPGEYRKTEDERREFIRRKRDNPAEILILAELDGEIVGNIDFHVGTRQRTAHAGEFGMGILPNVRSRGVGTLLLERLIAWAREVPQLEKINLRVISNNPRAMGLYRKLGFLEEGTRVREIKYSDGSYADEILMSKLLS
jgi:RimJ/RimL family protein N-acetyltransferase